MPQLHKAQLKAMSSTVVRGSVLYSAMTKRVMETFTHVSELNLVPEKKKKKKVFGVDLLSQAGARTPLRHITHVCLRCATVRKWLTVEDDYCKCSCNV